MNIKYFVELTAEERNQLLDITKKGRQPARVINRANILLMADGWRHSDIEISEALTTGTSTVYRVKRDFVEYGLDVALSECDRPGPARKLDANEEALLVSIACSEPPALAGHWSC